jgi:short-subunit dehydrogenase
MVSSGIKQRAIIVGASSGIGRSAAITFARAGICLALVGRSSEKLESLAHEIEEIGGVAKFYSLDLLDGSSVATKVISIVEELGGVDTLVNCAAIAYTSSLAETSLVDWQNVLAINLTGIFQVIQGVLPQMRRQKKGTIINIASQAAHSAFPNWGAYSVSKAGLVSFSEILAVEERTNGIRVTVITPGLVNTPIWESVESDFDRDLMLSPETVAQVILQTALLPSEAVIEKMTILPSAGSL